MNFADLRRHRAELERAVRNYRYERTEAGGIFVPSMKSVFGGVFRHRLNGADEQIDANAMLFVGLDALLGIMFKGETQFPAFYVAAYSNNVDPSQSLTNANIVSTLGEFTHYTETARPTWTPGDVDTQSISNAGDPAVFTSDSTGGTVWGAWLTTAATKSSTTSQTPIAASKFAGARVLGSGDKLSVEYAFTAADA